MSGETRRRALSRGHAGERLAAWMLRLKGYRILARGARERGGEIDIVARRGRTLAIVEVKARPTLAGALESLGAVQRRRIEAAAEGFVAARPALAGLDVRFDLIAIVPGRWPRHVEDAWRP